jgi:hypothetical protein
MNKTMFASPDEPAYTLRRVWLTKEQEERHYSAVSAFMIRMSKISIAMGTWHAKMHVGWGEGQWDARINTPIHLKK